MAYEEPVFESEEDDPNVDEVNDDLDDEDDDEATVEVPTLDDVEQIGDDGEDVDLDA